MDIVAIVVLNRENVVELYRIETMPSTKSYRCFNLRAQIVQINVFVICDQSHNLLLRKALDQLRQVLLHLRQLFRIDGHVHHEQVPHLCTLHRLCPPRHERTKTKSHLLRNLILTLNVIYGQWVVCFTDTASIGLISEMDSVVRIHIGLTLRTS